MPSTDIHLRIIKASIGISIMSCTAVENTILNLDHNNDKKTES